jgi:DNA-binding NtrC family response regulator
MVENNDGYVDVQSQEGKGSTFSIFFPCLEVEEVQDNGIIAIPHGNETILFVDDEEEIVTMRSRMLNFLGYTVLPAMDGEKALELFKEDPQAIDLLITDQTMPRMTGVELASAVHILRPDLPIILCSGYSEAVGSDTARRAGICKFLDKPLDMKVLAKVIRELVEKDNRE